MAANRPTAPRLPASLLLAVALVTVGCSTGGAARDAAADAAAGVAAEGGAASSASVATFGDAGALLRGSERIVVATPVGSPEVQVLPAPDGAEVPVNTMVYTHTVRVSQVLRGPQVTELTILRAGVAPDLQPGVAAGDRLAGSLAPGTQVLFLARSAQEGVWNVAGHSQGAIALEGGRTAGAALAGLGGLDVAALRALVDAPANAWSDSPAGDPAGDPVAERSDDPAGARRAAAPGAAPFTPVPYEEAPVTPPPVPPLSTPSPTSPVPADATPAATATTRAAERYTVTASARVVGPAAALLSAAVTDPGRLAPGGYAHQELTLTALGPTAVTIHDPPVGGAIGRAAPAGPAGPAVATGPAGPAGRGGALVFDGELCGFLSPEDEAAGVIACRDVERAATVGPDAPVSHTLTLYLPAAAPALAPGAYTLDTPLALGDSPGDPGEGDPTAAASSLRVTYRVERDGGG